MDIIYYVLFTIGILGFVCSDKIRDQDIYCLKDTECDLPMHAEDFTYEAVHWNYKESDNADSTKIGYWYENTISLKNGYNKTVLVEKRGEKDMHLKLKKAASNNTGIYSNVIVLINATVVNTENNLYVISKAWTACVDDTKQLRTKIDLNSSTDLVKNLTESYKDDKIKKIRHECLNVSKYERDGCYLLGEFVNGEKQCIVVETSPPCTCSGEYSRNKTLKGASGEGGKDASIGIIVGCVVGVVVLVTYS
ncbi:hypothetical protein SNE40_022933 [Patella caerulea]|uniref:Uncharacterized protein n=1 Tax=Patella caerulea TaxID=87958 RepID=A0AAN8IY46_PATCE